jgi:hypothetical protein
MASNGTDGWVMLPQQIFTRAQPLGPASLDDVRSRNEAAILFDDDNEIDSVLKRSSPVFLIGRRGSGKTAFLKRSASSGELTVDLNSPELISQVGETIRHLRVSRSGEFTERIVPIWEACFIAALCSKIWSNFCRLAPSDCPDAFRFGDRPWKSADGRATDIAAQLLLELRGRADAQGDYSSLSTLIDEVELNGIPLYRARASLAAAAKKENCAALVSLDSLDQYKDIFYEGGVLATHQAFALQGLFRAASRLGRSPDTFYKARVSFPAELWHFYSGLSANPLKDFDNSILLHWEHKELLHIAATRLLKYIESAEPAEYRRLDFSGQRARWPQELFLRYLPRNMRNATGWVEPTIPYLLRHTQLLPRHLIHTLNILFADRDLRPGGITEVEVRAAVAAAESKIVDTIINSYSLPYPHLRAVCSELIPHLSMSFDEPELHHIVNQSPDRGDEYSDILQMLIEVGAIGRFTESTGVYQEADFEYLHINRMLITNEDRLCLHPIFATKFDSPSTRRTSASGEKPVLPLGSDPSTEREFGRYIHITN